MNTDLSTDSAGITRVFSWGQEVKQGLFVSDDGGKTSEVDCTVEVPDGTPMEIKMPHRGVPCVNVSGNDSNENSAGVRPIVDVLPFKRGLCEGKEVGRRHNFGNGETTVRGRRVRSLSLMSLLSGDGKDPTKRLQR